ncbi:MAG TPA: DNA repair protein RecO [Terriglobia bacterium]|nr:DNA repair protein RecO [Terriglobia bacterium]
MPLKETEAIVLRTYRLGEADKIVSLFGRQLGRVRAAATGAQRPKSRYGGMLEPLTYVRLWLYEREHRDLLRLNSAELLESFFAMQGDRRIQIAAQYLAETAERFLPEREVNERAFRLWLAVLRAMKQTGEIDRPLLYFNYWLLRLGGFLPGLVQCAGCGRDLAGEAGHYARDPLGVFCRSCRSRGTAGKVSAAGLALLEKARRTPLAEWIAVAEPDAAATREARRLLETWVAASAEGNLTTLELLATEG